MESLVKYIEFVMIYECKHLLKKLIAEELWASDYYSELINEIDKLAEEFLKSKYDNEDLDLLVCIEMFLNDKIR